MMVIDSKFDLGQSVFLKTDAEQHERVVTAISVNFNGITYGLSCGTAITWHFEVEIAVERNVLKV